MNIKKMLPFLLLLPFSYILAETPFEDFQKKYPGLIYQDIVIEKDIYSIGTDLCQPRYELIKPVLDLYDVPFSTLDLGAAQGYFSFRIAQDYPLSSCFMVESNNTSYYSRHGDMLYDLCLANSHLTNITYFHKRLSLSDLEFFNQKQHFDVIMAFLVVHLMHDTLKEKIKIIESLLNLGDNLILEVANDVDVIHTAHIEYLSEHLDCTYLGEVKRHKDTHSTSTGKLFWFQKKSPQLERVSSLEIDEETALRLNLVYPTQK
jgi:hypothetical protein